MNAKATATETPEIFNACLCSTFEVVTREYELENGQPEYDAETTGCTEQTRREFAPGHDAKLKSMLIRAGVAGHEVRRNLGGVVHMSSAEKAAEGFGFAHMVIDGIRRGLAKADARSERQQAKQERPARTRKAAKTVAPAVQPEKVQVKVGRWTYDATIDASGDAHYTNAKGDAATAVQGTYKLV